MLNEADLCRLLPEWRKASRVKQQTLAEMLGVTQTLVSNWETGKAAPGKRLRLRLLDIMSPAGAHRVDADRLALEKAPNPRASLGLDGVRLVCASRGMHALWPTFSSLTNTRLIERLVDEASLFLHDEDFVKAVRRGEVAMVSAVSRRHVAIDVDQDCLHHWLAVFRGHGTSMHVEMTYEPCDAIAQTGIRDVVFFDDLAA